MPIPKLIIVCGPTASGKTSLAIDIALQLQTEIISCDARQFYRELNIGVAKPSSSQLSTVTHHFIGQHSIAVNYSPADFERDAMLLLDQLFQKHQCVVVCGGSGLYIDALCNGLDDMPNITEETKQQVNELSLQDRLSIIQANDLIYYNEMDRNNMRRVQRATEVILQSKLPFSSFRHGIKKQRNFAISKYGIDLSREEMYSNINQRVDEMIAAGLEEEARKLHTLLPNKNLDTIGYREFFEYFDAKISKVEAIDKIKQHTRNYAKRQMTWFRKDQEISWISKNQFQTLLNDLKE